MAWKLKYRCKACGYEAEVYEGRGLFRQQTNILTIPVRRPNCWCVSASSRAICSLFQVK